MKKQTPQGYFLLKSFIVAPDVSKWFLGPNFCSSTQQFPWHRVYLVTNSCLLLRKKTILPPHLIKTAQSMYFEGKPTWLKMLSWDSSTFLWGSLVISQRIKPVGHSEQIGSKRRKRRKWSVEKEYIQEPFNNQEKKLHLSSPKVIFTSSGSGVLKLKNSMRVSSPFQTISTSTNYLYSYCLNCERCQQELSSDENVDALIGDPSSAFFSERKKCCRSHEY